MNYFVKSIKSITTVLFVTTMQIAFASTYSDIVYLDTLLNNRILNATSANTDIATAWSSLSNDIAIDILNEYARLHHLTQDDAGRATALNQINGNYATENFDITIKTYLSNFPSYNFENARAQIIANQFENAYASIELALRPNVAQMPKILDPLILGGSQALVDALNETLQLLPPELITSLNINPQANFLLTANQFQAFRLARPKSAIETAYIQINNSFNSEDRAHSLLPLFSETSPLIFDDYTILRESAGVRLLELIQSQPLDVQNKLKKNVLATYYSLYARIPPTDLNSQLLFNIIVLSAFQSYPQRGVDLSDVMRIGILNAFSL